MKHTPIKDDPVPPRVEDIVYDKFMRKLWEMDQKIKSLERATLDSVSLEMVFEKLKKLEDIIADITVINKK